MDKIYSRRKIKLPKIKTIKTQNKRIKKIYFTVLILIVATLTVYKIMESIDPIFEGLCISKAQGIATEITNTKSSEVLAKYNYKDMGTRSTLQGIV